MALSISGAVPFVSTTPSEDIASTNNTFEFNLAPELLRRVADEVLAEDLPTFRLVCRAFNMASFEPFGNKRLAHLRFLCSRHSMQGFLDLTAHPNLGKYVKSVSFCTNVLQAGYKRLTNFQEALVQGFSNLKVHDLEGRKVGVGIFEEDVTPTALCRQPYGLAKLNNHPNLRRMSDGRSFHAKEVMEALCSAIKRAGLLPCGFEVELNELESPFYLEHPSAVDLQLKEFVSQCDSSGKLQLDLRYIVDGAIVQLDVRGGSLEIKGRFSTVGPHTMYTIEAVPSFCRRLYDGCLGVACNQHVFLQSIDLGYCHIPHWIFIDIVECNAPVLRRLQMVRVTLSETAYWRILPPDEFFDGQKLHNKSPIKWFFQKIMTTVMSKSAFLWIFSWFAVAAKTEQNQEQINSCY